ncbi:hypothetical protein FTUN_0026 [Frigoriglobus tundricola]|uniref:Uncharacterized protein n=1 Tax=Frigoriglobus tundricola TaxID=2774151 RepID=A0A6M5YGS6_9BACT|nr:hypothetical protein FTUN_0026 [Frigoriglobus tundricola]
MSLLGLGNLKQTVAQALDAVRRKVKALLVALLTKLAKPVLGSVSQRVGDMNPDGHTPLTTPVEAGERPGAVRVAGADQ